MRLAVGMWTVSLSFIEGVVDVGEWGDTNWACLIAYNDLLKHGVCPEQARMVLPQSMMTEWYSG